MGDAHESVASAERRGESGGARREDIADRGAGQRLGTWATVEPDDEDEFELASRRRCRPATRATLPGLPSPSSSPPPRSLRPRLLALRVTSTVAFNVASTAAFDVGAVRAAIGIVISG